MVLHESQTLLNFLKTFCFYLSIYLIFCSALYSPEISGNVHIKISKYNLGKCKYPYFIQDIFFLSNNKSHKDLNKIRDKAKTVLIIPYIKKIKGKYQIGK